MVQSVQLFLSTYGSHCLLALYGLNLRGEKYRWLLLFSRGKGHNDGCSICPVDDQNTRGNTTCLHKLC